MICVLHSQDLKDVFCLIKVLGDCVLIKNCFTTIEISFWDGLSLQVFVVRGFILFRINAPIPYFRPSE